MVRRPPRRRLGRLPLTRHTFLPGAHVGSFDATPQPPPHKRRVISMRTTTACDVMLPGGGQDAVDRREADSDVIGHHLSEHALAGEPLDVSCFCPRGRSRPCICLALGLELGVDARRAIGSMRSSVDRADTTRQIGVGARPSRGGSAPPGVIVRGRNLQDAGHCINGIDGLVRTYEPVNPFGLALLSRANQAAAFARMSRS